VYIPAGIDGNLELLDGRIMSRDCVHIVPKSVLWISSYEDILNI
jgi:hypothetical protein